MHFKALITLYLSSLRKDYWGSQYPQRTVQHYTFIHFVESYVTWRTSATDVAPDVTYLRLEPLQMIKPLFLLQRSCLALLYHICISNIKLIYTNENAPIFNTSVNFVVNKAPHHRPSNVYHSSLTFIWTTNTCSCLIVQVIATTN